jgi:hypothetical protein
MQGGQSAQVKGEDSATRDRTQRATRTHSEDRDHSPIQSSNELPLNLRVDGSIFPVLVEGFLVEGGVVRVVKESPERKALSVRFESIFVRRGRRVFIVVGGVNLLFVVHAGTEEDARSQDEGKRRGSEENNNEPEG